MVIVFSWVTITLHHNVKIVILCLSQKVSSITGNLPGQMGKEAFLAQSSYVIYQFDYNQ